ncbi:MAG: hypothetical protein GYB67_17570 [Chloroflexi bacterium]|nr:hypothetical protein [Chloroflexota bacterium]
MLQNLQKLTLGQRRLVFFMIVGGVILGFGLLTWLLVNQALTPNVRVQALALADDVTVAEFAALPDDDAYPAAVTVGPDGTVYTGSFATGAVWAIAADGTLTEIDETRRVAGGVAGLAVAADGALLIVDSGATDPRSSGGRLLRVPPDDAIIREFAYIDDDTGFVAPNDIVITPDGSVFVSDSGRNEIWRFNADGSGGSVWWVPPSVAEGARLAITGLAYDPAHDALIITEPERGLIYRALLADGATEILYEHGQRENPPGFDGVTVAPDGTIYVAAFGQNGIAIVADGALEYIVGRFRGASDVAYADGRLYVPNFDQASLVVPLFQPQLPFALDVITLGE